MASHFGQRFGRSRTRAALRTLAAAEAPEVLDAASNFPIVLRAGRGARVQDADGNRYVDLTSFFGVALVGHGNPAVVAAVRRQAGHLAHAMGDVHPADVKALLLAELARRMPAPDYRAVLGLNGSDAVECALKFAAAATGRGGVLAFEGAYHGLTAGALEVTHGATFRAPFAVTLANRASFAPWPAADGSDLDAALDRIAELVRGRSPGGAPIGALIVEPIQGRGGIRVPPAGFLAGLVRIAADAGLVLIADEIYTGVGRTGPFLACMRDGIVPDVVCVGKALGGGVPISACLMRPHVADAVRRAGAEAVHTSTFLGHPLGCAAALAVLHQCERHDLGRAAVRIGSVIRARAKRWAARFPAVRDVRGEGAMIGVDLRLPDGTPASDLAGRVLASCLAAGVILLTEGPALNVLAFTPPAVIRDTDLEFALDTVASALAEASR